MITIHNLYMIGGKSIESDAS